LPLSTVWSYLAERDGKSAKKVGGSGGGRKLVVLMHQPWLNVEIYYPSYIHNNMVIKNSA
jgi:hypothetical protein